MAADPPLPNPVPAVGASAAPILAIDGLKASYGNIEILHGVSLAVFPGEIVSIIGPNGAGKSTVLKAVMGFLRPLAGSIRFQGREIGGEQTYRIVRQGIGYVPQGRIVFPGMSVSENLEMGAFSVSDKRRIAASLDNVLTLFPRLAERRRQLAGTMSGGEQQMLAMGRALMLNPPLILMDEPSLGLAPIVVEQIFAKIVEMQQAGLTLLLVEQNATRALAASDRGYVLELGTNTFENSGAGLLADERVRRLYLGG